MEVDLRRLFGQVAARADRQRRATRSALTAEDEQAILNTVRAVLGPSGLIVAATGVLRRSSELGEALDHSLIPDYRVDYSIKHMRLVRADAQSATVDIDATIETVTTSGPEVRSRTHAQGPVQVVRESDAWNVADLVIDGVSLRSSFFENGARGSIDGLTLRVLGGRAFPTFVLAYVELANDLDRTVTVESLTVGQRRSFLPGWVGDRSFARRDVPAGNDARRHARVASRRACRRRDQVAAADRRRSRRRASGLGSRTTSRAAVGSLSLGVGHGARDGDGRPARPRVQLVDRRPRAVAGRRRDVALVSGPPATGRRSTDTAQVRLDARRRRDRRRALLRQRRLRPLRRRERARAGDEVRRAITGGGVVDARRVFEEDIDSCPYRVWDVHAIRGRWWVVATRGVLPLTPYEHRLYTEPLKVIAARRALADELPGSC
jgi:hypothetical protein